MSDLHDNTIELLVTSDTEKLRLDLALSKLEAIGSRSKATKLIQSGLVTRNGKKTKPSHITELNDVYVITLPRPTEAILKPYAFDLDIVFEDNDLIVINKPSGLVVHPAVGHENDTLVNALIYHCKDLSMGFSESRPGIVHRLDKDTSGLIVIAKNNTTHAFLAEQFKTKSAGRVYWALTFGAPKEREGTIQSHLGRNPHHRKKMCSLEQIDPEVPIGKLAVTHYKTLQQHASGIALIECRLETGRTHQIRVHLSDLNCPIIGDELYGGLKRSKNLKSLKLRAMIKKLNRVALHAQSLEFYHPKDNLLTQFVAPVPKELDSFLNELDFAVEP